MRLARFHATYIVGATLTIIIGESLVALAHLNATLAHAIAIAFTTGVNFILLRLWTYRSRGDEAAAATAPSSPSSGAPRRRRALVPFQMEIAEDSRSQFEVSEPILPRYAPAQYPGMGASDGAYATGAPDTLADLTMPDLIGASGRADSMDSLDLPVTAKVPRAPGPTPPPEQAPRFPEPQQAPRRGGTLGQLAAAVKAMRIKQWTKNGLVVLAAVFARTLTDVATAERAALAFLAFSLAASSIYIINDIADREKDRRHPRKRFRPIASGALGIPRAVALAALCIAGAAAISAYMLVTPFVGAASPGVDPFARYGGGSLLFVVSLGVYVAQNIAYSTWLKHLVLWDVFSIAFGFVLRAMAGAFAADVYISPWFYLCAIFLSLFLALGKRRAELVQVTSTDSVGATRKNLQHYTLQLLDQLMIVVVTCAVMAYSLYTFQGEAYSHRMMITIPFVIFGVARYMYLVYVKAEGERPDELLFQDKQILGAVALCGLVVVAVLYGPQALGIISHLPL